MEGQCRFGFGIRDYSSRAVSQCGVEHGGGSINLSHVSPSHLQVQHAQSSSMAMFTFHSENLYFLCEVLVMLMYLYPGNKRTSTGIFYCFLCFI